MSNYDPSQETRRLAELYAAMGDGELEEIASEGAELTDEAREALVGELKRRKSNILIGEPVSADQVDFRELATVRQFGDLPDALLANGLLDSAGVKSYLANGNLIRMEWYVSNLVGGLKLQVSLEDAEAANELLNQPIPQEFEVDGVGNFQQPRCPQCQSVDISFEAVGKGIRLATGYMIGVPLPATECSWRCLACGYT